MPDTKIKLSDENGAISYETIAAAAELARMGLLVTLIDEQGTLDVLFISSRVEQLLGRSAEEIRANGVWAYIAAEELPRLLELYENRLHDEPPPERQETVVVSSDGRRVPIEMFHSVVDVEQGRVGINFVREISDRYEAEEELRRSEQRFRTLVENAPDGIAIIKGTHIAYLNRSGAEMAGLDDPAAVIGRPVADFVDAADEGRIAERLSAIGAAVGGPVEPILYRTVDARGRGRAIETLMVPIEYQGEPAALAFIRDVTERIELQNRLAQADRLSALGTLAAGLAHEINNPLTYVTINIARAKKQLSLEMKRADGEGATSVPSSREETAKLMRMLDDAQQGVERVTDTVRDIQRFARPPTDEKQVIPLGRALDGALMMASHAISHKAQVVREYREAPAVFASPSRLERLFLNLVINAAQALEHAERTDRRIVVSVFAAGERAAVEIVDNGCGMDQQTAERIFDPFFTTKPAGVGTGLGLAICKSITDELGGTIEVSSQPGEGTRFRVVLPTHGEKAAEPGRDGAAHRRRQSSGSFKAAEARAAGERAKLGRLLLVDDEPNVARALEAYLSGDFEVETVYDGTDALRLVEAGEPFHAVLCDLAMPGMNGAELYRALRELDPELADRTVLMTGMLETAITELLGSDIESPLLRKPFDPDEARELLVRLVKGDSKASG